MNIPWSSRGIDIQVAIVLIVIGVITAATMWAGTVHNLGTAGSLSSILGLAVTVFIFWIARRLSQRVRRTRMSLLRRDDLRNRNHMIVMTNLCRSLVLGAKEGDPDSPAALSAMRDTAFHIGEFSTTYEYLLTDQGKKLAEKMRATALVAIAGMSCANVDIPHILTSLEELEGEILEIDSDTLVRRREQEVGAEDSG